jgi:hypothetical protein
MQKGWYSVLPQRWTPNIVSWATLGLSRNKGPIQIHRTAAFYWFVERITNRNLTVSDAPMRNPTHMFIIHLLKYPQAYYIARQIYLFLTPLPSLIKHCTAN